MAIINLYSRLDDDQAFSSDEITHDGSVISWVLANIKCGENFKVYVGDIAHENEISRDADKMALAESVSVFLLPAGQLLVPLLVSLVVSVAVAILSKPKSQSQNQTGGSPNNSLSSRSNEARPNQRIPEIVGKVLSVPDVIQQEFSRFVNNNEERYGYYCVGVGQIQIEELKDGDSFLADVAGSSAGIYYPNKSPNNSVADIEIGDAIVEPIYSVYESPDAIGQTLRASNELSVALDDSVKLSQTGVMTDSSGKFEFDKNFSIGDSVFLHDLVIIGALGLNFVIGENTHDIIGVTATTITFDITLDSSWSDIGATDENLFDPRNRTPQIIKNEVIILGPFRIATQKIDKLLVGCFAPNGMYREGASGRFSTSVEFSITAVRLDDNFDVVGAPIVVIEKVRGGDSNQKGTSVEIDFGTATFCEFYAERLTLRDYSFNGQIVDELKLKNAFGLGNITKTDFGNITTIQTKRISTEQATSIKEPKLNCFATEMVYKYLGSSVFDTILTPNTQAMQSLIRLALDPFVGRREASEIDLDLLLSTQSEIEIYFGTPSAAECSYTFDLSNISAQETFFTIANSVFCILWREGRLLKSWFERPQTIPQMVFTHRSKEPDSETWRRDFFDKKRKDSIEFKYTDEKFYTEETLYFPADRSGRNPLKLKIPGIKGIDQATWRMLREFNKLKYQEVSVDFSATQEGRFVLPSRLISVVKGSRVASFDGYVISIAGLILELSQDVVFTPGDDHFILLKRRDGTTESITATDIGEKRRIQIGSLPTETIYTGNDESKTEFSFGNEARLSGQLVLPQEITPNGGQYVNIKAINYTDNYYAGDPDQVTLGEFDDSFDESFG